MTKLGRAERELLGKFLSGDHPILLDLRRQDVVSVRSREMTGVGFRVHLEVDRQVSPAAEGQTFNLHDVHGTVPGLEHGAGFVLFIEDGAYSWEALEFNSEPRALSQLEIPQTQQSS